MMVARGPASEQSKMARCLGGDMSCGIIVVDREAMCEQPLHKRASSSRRIDLFKPAIRLTSCTTCGLSNHTNADQETNYGITAVSLVTS
jgi:hypothetical protein